MGLSALYIVDRRLKLFISCAICVTLELNRLLILVTIEALKDIAFHGHSQGAHDQLYDPLRLFASSPTHNTTPPSRLRRKTSQLNAADISRRALSELAPTPIAFSPSTQAKATPARMLLAAVDEIVHTLEA